MSRAGFSEALWRAKQKINVAPVLAPANENNPPGSVPNMKPLTKVIHTPTGTEIETNTYQDLKESPCAGFGISHFYSLDEIHDLYSQFFDIVSIKMSYLQIEELLDNLVAEYFEANQDSPVFTSAHFILPLNALLFSAQNLGHELVDLIRYISEFEEM